MIETQPIPIANDKLQTNSKYKMPEQHISTDSGIIFTRSQSVRNELPAEDHYYSCSVDENTDDKNDDDDCSSLTSHKTAIFDKRLRPLMKKTSKDSGIDCRIKSDSVGSDAIPETGDDDDDDDGVDKGGGFASLPPNHTVNTTASRDSDSNVSSSNNNNNNNMLSVEDKNTVIVPEVITENVEMHNTTTAEDDFRIDPNLINKSDGLKQTYFFTDEHGSPKILEDLIERDVEKRSKKVSSDDIDLFGCLGFSRLTRIFKNSRKYILLTLKLFYVAARTHTQNIQSLSVQEQTES